MRKVTYYGGASERTRLYDPSAAERTDEGPMGDANPVVGWVVIIEGPGKGRSLEIGIGANPIGRNADQRISLDFGDNNIHREKHAVIIFDPKSGHFYLQAGNDSGNLTYLDDSLVRSSTELRGGETLTVGRTKLRFVAFCGPDFSWF